MLTEKNIIFVDPIDQNNFYYLPLVWILDFYNILFICTSLFKHWNTTKA